MKFFSLCVHARANLHTLMTRNSCAVGMHNVILRNHLKSVFGIFGLTVVVFFPDMDIRNSVR